MAYRLNPNVVFTELDPETSEAVLLHLKTRQYFSLNETGTFIWKQMEAGHPVETIVEAMVETFEVETSAARQNLQAFIEALTADALIQST